MSPDTLHMEGLTAYIEDIQWLLYPFALVLLFIVTTLLVFLRISLYALAALLFIYIMKRRGEYRHVWRTCAFAVTWSILLSIVLAFNPLSGTIVTILSMVITLLVAVAITNYQN